MSADTEIAALQSQIADLASVGATKAPQIAAALEARVRRTAEAGQAPDGTAWDQTRTGTAPLQGVGAALRSTHVRVGSVTHVTVRLRGHHVLHDAGLANGAPRRQVLPDQFDDDAIAEVVDVISQQVDAVLA
jgi:hypothetical protein